MNPENNNFNPNFNKKPDRPAQPVKNKFFNFDMNSNNNDVGATASSGTSNVISWGVGKKDVTSFSNQNGNLNQASSIESLEDYGVNQVNGDIFNGGNIETLDEFPNNRNNFNNGNQFFPQSNNQFNSQSNFNNNESLQMPKLNNSITERQNNNFNQFNNPNVMNQFNGPSSPIFAEAQNSSNQMQNNQNNQQGLGQQVMQQQTSNNQSVQNSGWQNGIGATSPQGTEWVNNQPLSAASLGGASMNAENQPKDVVEQSRFFNANINNEIQSKQNNVAQMPMQYGNGVGIMLDAPPPVFDELSALKQFVGNDFTKLSMSIFSFSSFIFGSLIFLHRKMYILGVILTLIEFGISFFVPLKYAIVAILVIHVILALMVNPMYIKYSKKKVKAILSDKNNMKKNQVEIDNLCKKKGKNNLLLAIIIYMICGGLMFAISSATNISEIIKSSLGSITSKIGNDDKSNEEEENKEKAFDIEDYINITMPEVFIKADNDTYSYVYVTDDSKDNSSCEVLIDRIKNVDDVEDYANKLRDRYNIVESVGMNNINDIMWYTLVLKNDNKVYYRVAKLQDISIMLEYKIGSEADSSICETHYSNIVSSIKVKEN